MNTANISQCPEVTLKCFLLSRFPRAIALGTLGEIPLNRSKDSARVLYLSAIALKLAKTWQQTPQTIAAQLAETLEPLCYPDFAVKVAPAGIIELELTDPGLAVWLQRLAQTNLPLPKSRILSPVVWPIGYFRFSTAMRAAVPCCEWPPRSHNFDRAARCRYSAANLVPSDSKSYPLD